MKDVACAKCKGWGTKRHHRRCPKRGMFHRGREVVCRQIEKDARRKGLRLHIRRGRHGDGPSISRANQLVQRWQAPAPVTLELVDGRVCRCKYEGMSRRRFKPEPLRVWEVNSFPVKVTANLIVDQLHSLAGGSIFGDVALYLPQGAPVNHEHLKIVEEWCRLFLRPHDGNEFARRMVR